MLSSNLSNVGEEAPSDRPLVTYAVFAYNQEDVIDDAVASALKQTYQPLQIIISDDNSSDATFDKITHQAKNYTGPHTILLNRNNQNLGIAEHMNRIFYELAEGEWVVCAAGDDISLPHRVEVLWRHGMSQPNCRAIHSSLERIDATGRHICFSQAPPITFHSLHETTMHGASAAYHRPTVTRFPRLYAGTYEDRVFAPRALLHGDVCNVVETLVKWRRHGDNTSSKANATTLEQVKFRTGPFLLGQVRSMCQQLSDLFEFERNYPNEVRPALLEYKRNLIKSVTTKSEVNLISNYVFSPNSTKWPSARPRSWAYFARILFGQLLSATPPLLRVYRLFRR